MILTSEITQFNQAQTLPDPDLPLVQAAKEGSMAAFDELVKRHERQMFRIAFNLLHNREDAQDAVQEAFLKLFQKLFQFQAKAKFSTWLTRITVNAALSKLRKEPAQWSSMADEPRDDDDSLPREIADWAPSPETLYSVLELHEILEKTLRRLKPGLRAVFLLHDLEGFSLEEAAQTLGLSVTAVKTRSFRARLQLREWLTHYFRNDNHPLVSQFQTEQRPLGA